MKYNSNKNNNIDYPLEYLLVQKTLYNSNLYYSNLSFTRTNFLVHSAKKAQIKDIFKLSVMWALEPKELTKGTDWKDVIACTCSMLFLFFIKESEILNVSDLSIYHSPDTPFFYKHNGYKYIETEISK